MADKTLGQIAFEAYCATGSPIYVAWPELRYQSSWEAAAQAVLVKANDGSHWDGCWRAHHVCAIAEVEQLENELTGRKDAYRSVMLGVCHIGPSGEDKHCACVPWLREAVRDRDAEIERLRKVIAHAVRVFEENAKLARESGCLGDLQWSESQAEMMWEALGGRRLSDERVD